MESPDAYVDTSCAAQDCPLRGNVHASGRGKCRFHAFAQPKDVAAITQRILQHIELIRMSDKYSNIGAVAQRRYIKRFIERCELLGVEFPDKDQSPGKLLLVVRNYLHRKIAAQKKLNLKQGVKRASAPQTMPKASQHLKGMDILKLS